MAKEMNVACNFLTKQMVCELTKTDNGCVAES